MPVDYSPLPFLSHVNTYCAPAPGRLAPVARLMLGGAGLGLVVVLAVAACLTPSPQGLGTHEQLGLPPCTFRLLFGLRCPSCGMTTSWAYALHGQPRAALAANAGGLTLCVVALLLAPYLLISAARGKWLFALPNDKVLAISALAVALITLADWVFRIAVR